MRLHPETAARTVAAPAAKKWGDEGGSGVQGWSPGKNFSDHALFYARKHPFYRQGTHMFTAGEHCSNATQHHKEQRDSQDLGITDGRCCKQSYVC